MSSFSKLMIAVPCILSCNGSNSPRPHTDEVPAPVARRDAATTDAPQVSDSASRVSSMRASLDALDPPVPPPRPLSRKHRRGDCKPSYAPRPKRDPNPMCRVEGGTFMFGGGTYLVNGEDGQREVQVPAVATTVRSFYIDQFEVTAAQAAVFLNAHGNVCEDGIESPKLKKQDPRPNVCVWIEPRVAGIEEKNGRYVARRGQEHWPVYVFTWEGALRYCAWTGKRVPSSAQWEYAARHDSRSRRDLVYPWGDTWVAHAAACNDPQCDRRPNAPQAPDVDPLPVGIFDGTRGRSDGSSPWGAHDMAGGSEELVFGCTDPDDTCESGETCDCNVLTTSSFGSPNLVRLRTDHRIDVTRLGFGSTGVRCALPSP